MPEDQVVHQYILEHFVETSRAPSQRETQEHFALSRHAVQETLQRLEDMRAFHRDPHSKRIVAAYPFSARPTAHRVRLPNGRVFFALCAIDALGMPLMLKTNATITSACVQCGVPITVEMRQGRVYRYAPDTVRVWDMKRDKQQISAVACCPHMNFFCSSQHLTNWQADHPQIEGHGITLARAFKRGHQFKDLLRGPGRKGWIPSTF